MKVLVLDTETTGLDPEQEKLIEIAACVYDTETQTILESYQTLLYSEDNTAQEINHISPEALKKMDKEQKKYGTEILLGLAACSDYIIAHNAQFDKKFLESNDIKLEIPWVCSKADIDYPGRHSSSRLGHLCYDFDIPVLKAHSALHDVYILIELLKKVPDLDKQLKSANEPKEEYVALINYAQRDLAKAAGFNWNAKDRLWTKMLKESQINDFEFEIQKKV